MFHRIGWKIFSLSAAVMLAGCATLMEGREQQVTIDTVNVKGALCEGKDKAGMYYRWDKTPGSATVVKGDGPIKVTCQAEGFKDSVFMIKEDVAGATFANVVTLGLGALVDAASGAAQRYPGVVRFVMKPVDDAPKGVHDAYNKAIRDIEEAKRKAKEKEEKQIRSAGS